MPEKHFIEVGQEEKVAAVHHPAAGSERFIFFCHGFGSDKEGSYVERCEKAVENDWNGVRLDFRGNGESDGDFIDQDLSSRIEDLEAVVNHFSPRNFAVFGSSFGGKVAFHATPEIEADAVVGKAPVTYNSIMDKFRAAVKQKGEFEYIDGKPIDQRFFDDLDTYSFEEVAASIDVPVAIFHGSADTTVHTENSFRAAQQLDTDVVLHKLQGEKHSFSEEAEQKLISQMMVWLDQVL